MTARELRQKYLEFFQSKGHAVYPSGSLVPYDVTGRLDESLLFNGAGLVQFKPFFRGIAEPPSKRLTNCQKCVRTGDIESVGDLTHLTFFEMLGNFSFGDYFKKDAIAFSWEFMTSAEWLGLEPSRLSFTVFEDDDEAFACWSGHAQAAGLEPERRIFRLGEDTNYWPMGAFSNGPPGPCGPNTEMFYWVPTDEPPPPAPLEEGAASGDPPYSRDDWLRDEAAGKWLEIWNDVFIQYEWKGRLRDPERPTGGFEKEGLDSLPFQSVDTGMGLERTVTALNGKRSVYDNDLFEPVFRALSECDASAPMSDPQTLESWATESGDSSPHSKAARIIADHVRTAAFCVADGVLPGNTGRGYVLRRVIRRAVLKGQRVLGFEKPFLHKVFAGVLESLGGHYSELTERREAIVETLRNEEQLFRRTLLRGSELLYNALEVIESSKGPSKQLPGKLAFQLYDTFGFPLEVTQELCAEAGIEVDMEGYERAMREAQERSRASHGMESVYGGVEIRIDLTALLRRASATPESTVFTGYDETFSMARIVGALPVDGEEGAASGEFVVALDRSPFYAESGGQVSDIGKIEGEGFELDVVDVVKQDGVIVHLVRPKALDLDLRGVIGEAGARALNERLFDREVAAEVDAQRRARIVRNHTATHLLHAALRRVLGGHVTQQGSLVAPDHLRFDFSHGKAMAPAELAEVERMVNEKSLAGLPVEIYGGMPLAEAKNRGAMALFGEKYGDTVRMVEVPEFSLELCGGCHVRNTAEIGLFKVLHESSAASGVRRIEAVTGEGAYEWAAKQERLVHDAAVLLKSNPMDLVRAIERNLEALREERKKAERLAQQKSDSAPAACVRIGDVELIAELKPDLDPKLAALQTDSYLDGKPLRVGVLIATHDGKVTIVAKAGPEAVARGVHAGNLVRDLAKIVGGGGGGRPDFATAGGKDPSAASEARDAAEGLLAAQIGA